MNRRTLKQIEDTLRSSKAIPAVISQNCQKSQSMMVAWLLLVAATATTISFAAATAGIR